MYFCTVVGAPELRFASPKDASGHYGLTHVVCNPVTFGAGGAGPLTLVRSLIRIGELLTEI